MRTTVRSLLNRSRNRVLKKTRTVKRWKTDTAIFTLRQRQSGEWEASKESHDGEEFTVTVLSTPKAALAALGEDEDSLPAADGKD